MENFIPAKHAEIFWGTDTNGSPTDRVFVCDRRDRKLGTEEAIRVSREYNMSLGAMCSEWMIGEGRVDTPEGVFASFWLNSSVRPSIEALRVALGEFGKIDRCDWARDMLRAIENDSAYGRHDEAE